MTEGVGADGFLGEPGEDGEAGGVFRFYLVDVGLFAGGAGEQCRVLGGGEEEALVDDPGEGFDAGAAEVGLEAGGFVDGGGFGEGDQEDLGDGGVAKGGEEVADGLGHVARGAGDFAVVGFGGV